MSDRWSVVSDQWVVNSGGSTCHRLGRWLLTVALITGHWSLTTAFSAQWPSLFRDVVVADSPVGVRVVSVGGSSQASLADLRPEDVIVRVGSQEVHSIDEFAVLSKTLKGRAVKATVLVFRNGVPRELLLHLYSYPILKTWGLEFVPDHDLRFAEAQVGLDYWARLGRGFEEAGNLTDALNAYLNGLHNVPTDTATALKAATLFSRVGQQHLREHRLAAGVASLRQSVVMMEKLFDTPLTDEQLQAIRGQLQDTLRALRAAARESPGDAVRPSPEKHAPSP